MTKIGQMSRRAALITAGVTVFAACSHTASDEMQTQAASDGGHEGHEPEGNPPPEGITEAVAPTYPVGTTVVLAADHMPGMNGATATISGAFNTITYSVSYTPADSEDLVTDHK